jgi:hypothetical protein
MSPLLLIQSPKKVVLQDALVINQFSKVAGVLQMGFLKPHEQCCATGTKRSRNFKPEPELTFEVSAPGPVRLN